MVGIGFCRGCDFTKEMATARSGKTVEKWKIILNLKEILTDTESVGLFSDTNLDKFKEEGMGGHLLTSYYLRYARGAVAYFIFKVFQNQYSETCIGATLYRLFIV